MKEKEKEEALKRIEDLLNLQSKLFSEFGEDKYNVFIFGSYPTTGYNEQTSDVDVAGLGSTL